jgi:hypothetical protein
VSVIELTTFLLADDGDEAGFLEADAAAQTGFYYLQPEMVRRTTARGTAGIWLVMILWGSVGAADAAIESGRNDPVLQAFYDRVDVESVEVRRYFPLAG